MVSATKEKTYTCLNSGDDEFVTVQATNPTEAEQKVGSVLIIEEGTASAIGARRVKCVEGRLTHCVEGRLAHQVIMEGLQEGTVCSIVAGDPVAIADAVFQGIEEVDGLKWLVFRKNNIRFLTYRGVTTFTYIGGRRVY